MKHVQITGELLFMLARYHLLGEVDYEEKITEGLQRGLDSMTNRQFYTRYKTAGTPEEQERARQEYLDRRGYFSSFR